MEPDEQDKPDGDQVDVLDVSFLCQLIEYLEAEDEIGEIYEPADYDGRATPDG